METIECVIFDFYGVIYPYSDEARDLIEKLKTMKYKIGGISSLKLDVVEKIKAHYGIDYVLSAQECGMDKESSAIYRKFLQDFNFMAGECLVIDDEIARLKAAGKVGMKTVWLNKNKSENLLECDYTINDLCELLRVLSVKY